MRIDRCHCHQELFTELKQVADATGAATVEALQEHIAFGATCELCHPYVRRMLRTGATVFGTIITDADEPAPADEHAG